MNADNYNSANNTNNLLVARRTLDTLAVRTKVEQDIAFLTNRISVLQNHARPNRIVLDTYQNMLTSRVAVLKWLQHGSHDDLVQAGKRSA